MTNAAAAGLSPAALMARAGHSDFKTTQGYIDLADEHFREEAAPGGAALGLDQYKKPVQSRATERRRSRTYPAAGCAASPVLKTGWATGPVPLRG